MPTLASTTLTDAQFDTLSMMATAGMLSGETLADYEAEREWRASISTRPQPQEGPQTAFLASDADIVIYGGAAGGGKSYGLFLETLKDMDNPAFRWVYFRRQQTDIAKNGGPWDKSMLFFPQVGGKPNKTQYKWTFPSGAWGQLASLQYDQDVLGWQTAEIDLLEFDELTHFTEKQFWYMQSRLRSSAGIRTRVRAGCNPDAASWVKKLIAPWVDDRYDGYKPAAGELLYLARVVDASGEVQNTWVDSEWRYETGDKPLTITFIPSKVYDNKILMANDSRYITNLLSQSAVEKARLLDGDWNALDGTYFDTFCSDHTVDPIFTHDDKPPSWYTFFGGLDWGYADPYAFVLGCLDENGNAHILESEQMAKLNDPTQAMRVCAMLDRWGVQKQKCLIVADESMWSDKKDGLAVEPHIAAFMKAGLRCAKASNGHDDCVHRMSLIRNRLSQKLGLRIYNGYNRELIQSVTAAKEGKGSRKEYILHDGASHLVYALGCALGSWAKDAVDPEPPEKSDEEKAKELEQQLSGVMDAMWAQRNDVITGKVKAKGPRWRY